jgi:CubicO group peptidase (beta-lactamase class C family)
MMHGVTNWASWWLLWAHSRFRPQFAMELLQRRTQQSRSDQRRNGRCLPLKRREEKEAITVQNLLDMTSGIEWTQPLVGAIPTSLIEMQRSPDWVKFILDRPMSSAPGQTFNYNSGNAQLVSTIITKLAGMSALEYAKAKLFGPLGINDVFWRHDPQGISIGGDELYLQPRDMAKIGYLYLHNGVWEGEVLLPAAWIDKVSHATVDMHNRWEPNLRYSNFFWALPNKHVYMATGFNGQMVMVLPDLDVVAVTMARDSHNFGEFANFIFSSVKSHTALPDDAATALTPWQPPLSEVGTLIRKIKATFGIA